MTTIYSNLLNFKLTPTEIVFEFYNHFPDKPGVPLPPDLEPEIRVVMNVNVLDKLAEGFNQAAKKRQGDVEKKKAVGLVQTEKKQ